MATKDVTDLDVVRAAASAREMGETSLDVLKAHVSALAACAAHPLPPIGVVTFAEAEEWAEKHGKRLMGFPETLGPEQGFTYATPRKPHA